MLSAESIQENWVRFLNVIETTFKGDRKEKLLQFYISLEERICMMPASSIIHHHNCFPGGYVAHVLNVINCTQQVALSWKKMGCELTFTDEELVFAALNHDLGKIGSVDEPMYLENDSEWHRRTLGQMYKMNDKNEFFLIQDRSLFLLQQAGIVCTTQEWLAIRTHDGLYDKANESYYIGRTDSAKFRTNLPFILHQGDLMAARIEYETWKNANELSKPQQLIGGFGVTNKATSKMNKYQKLLSAK